MRTGSRACLAVIAVRRYRKRFGLVVIRFGDPLSQKAAVLAERLAEFRHAGPVLHLARIRLQIDERFANSAAGVDAILVTIRAEHGAGAVFSHDGGTPGIVALSFSERSDCTPPR